MERTILVEAKSGKVLQSLGSLKDIQVMPEILTITKENSDGPFYPAKDTKSQHWPGDVVEIEFLLVEGDILSDATVSDIIADFQDVKADDTRTLIAGIKGQHKIGGIVRL